MKKSMFVLQNMEFLFLILLETCLLGRRAAAANVRFGDKSRNVYLLKQPAFDRRVLGGSAADDATAGDGDRENNYFERGRGRHDGKADAGAIDYESEVQSFLVLQLPSPYLSKPIRPHSSSDSSPIFDQKPVGTTKFSIAEGGFEAEGELDDGATINADNSAAADVDGASSNGDSVTYHRSVEHEFTAKVLTFRVGREKPTVRVLVWRKSSARRNADNDSTKYLCVGVYAFHSVTNEFVFAHCPIATDSWPFGACVVDMLLPLKWWTPAHVNEGTYDGTEHSKAHTGHNRYTKVTLGLSIFSSMHTPPTSCSTGPTGQPASSTGTAGATVSYVLSVEAQRSLRIVGEVELIYPSEYALLPLNNVVKVLVPTIDCYPGTTFTVPIFVHYEPHKLNNSSVYLLQLRARASGRLRIVGVEDIYPDWTVTYSIEDSGSVVTSTAFHRSISLNESWAGEVFILLVKIGGDVASTPHGGTGSAQLTWSVRLVVDSALATDKTWTSDFSASQNSFTKPESPSSSTQRSTASSTIATAPNASTARGIFHIGNHLGETVSTNVNVQPDQLDTLAVIGNDEIVNTAVIAGQQVSSPIRVISISQGGLVNDITQKSHCVAIDPGSLKVSADCAFVYVDGTETKSNAHAAIGVQYGSYRTVARYTVWFPEFPMDIWLADPVLHAISGWTVPRGQSGESTTTKQPQFRRRRHNEQLRSRALHRRSKSPGPADGPCRQKFQESELKVYGRFRTADPTTGGQTYLGGVGRKVQLDLTQLARPFLRVKNGSVARLVHTKYATFAEGLNEGRTEIQLKSPVQGHIYGASGVETANERVHLRALTAEVITGLFSHTELRSPYPPVYNLAVYKSSIFFRRYQEGTVSLTMRYSDGHVTNLEVVDASYYRLFAATNGSVTVFPGSSNARHHHSGYRHTKDLDSDRMVLLPVKILTIDEHAEGARLNITLLLAASCQPEDPAGHALLGLASVPIEFPKQRANPPSGNDPSNHRENHVPKEAPGPLQSPDPPNVVQTLPSLEGKSSLDGEQEVQSYGNAPLLASISVSIFAVAGVLFAVCAVREGWVTVKSFARSQCRQWRLLVPLRVSMPPLVFASAGRCGGRAAGGRRSASSSSSSSLDDDGSRNRHGAKRKRRKHERLKVAAECTESSVVSAENEFVWLRPMSLTSSSNALPTGPSGGTARSLNGDTARRPTASYRSLNGDIERRLTNSDKQGKDNEEYLISENEFLDCCRSRRKSSGTKRASVNPSPCSSSSSTVSSQSGGEQESRVEECLDEDPLSDRAWQLKAYRPARKMSDTPQGYQRCCYVLHEGATTLPCGWSGSETYGSIGSSANGPSELDRRVRRKHDQHKHGKHRHDSLRDVFVQRLLSARSDPSVHVTPTPTTAEAAAAAVQAAKRQCTTRGMQQGRKNDRSTPMKNGHRRPQSFFPSQLLGSFCSGASSDAASSDVFWDSSTLGMNEAELRVYFNCLRESVT